MRDKPADDKRRRNVMRLILPARALLLACGLAIAPAHTQKRHSDLLRHG